jgi:hypothetical protein
MTEEDATSPSEVTITVRSERNEPITSADVLLVASNGTYLRERTDKDGLARFSVSKRRMLTVFCAHPARPAFVGPSFDPVRNLAITLPEIAGTGSLVSLGGWDTIPGLNGSMSPIHDSLNRLYVYAKNISVDGGKRQPVDFQIGKPTLKCSFAGGF